MLRRLTWPGKIKELGLVDLLTTRALDTPAPKVAVIGVVFFTPPLAVTLPTGRVLTQGPAPVVTISNKKSQFAPAANEAPTKLALLPPAAAVTVVAPPQVV